MTRSLILITLLFLTACEARKAPAPLPASPEAVQPQCTSTPCGNTASGKDPQEERIEEGRRMRHALLASDDDHKRWSVSIYSDSILPEDLTLEVLRSPRMTMRLMPPEGHLAITTPTSKHVFEIANPQGSVSVCPKYQIRVLEGSDVHILLQMICKKFEYKPDRYAMSVTYYLYDQPTGMMREIWRAGAGGKDDRLPLPDPSPALKRIADGYQFDWSGTYPGSIPGEAYEINNRFTRKREGEELILDCTNVAPGATAEPEDQSSCEGAYLERVEG